MDKKRKVLIAEKVDNECIKLLETEADVDVKLNMSREELLNEIEKYDALIIRSSVKVDKELFSYAKKLKIVGRAGNGIDNIDVDEATKQGIVVANTPESNTISACELAIGLILAQARNISYADNFLKSGKWDRKRFMGVEIYNKTLGIIGLGKIGSLVAERMSSFGMKIIAYDPYISDERFERYGAEKKGTLDELLAEADFITIHTPKTEETKNMIGKEEIKKMKDGVRIINAARGGIINEKDLLEGLKSGKVASAGLDVHEEEPCYNNPLFKLNNVVVTPHIGATTVEAQQNVGITIAKQVLNVFKGEIVENAVNLPTLNRKGLKTLGPYIELMENLGKIYYQIYNNPVELVDIQYYGNIAYEEVEMINIAFIKGLLEPIMKDHVNYVNAKVLAKQRGIIINQNKNSDNYNGFTDLIKIKIKNKENTFTLAGNLSSKNEGKLVELMGYEVDVNPTQHMLFIQNMDVPGVIGDIGTILGKERVNIATMQVGRNERGEKALMVLNVDDYISNETLNNLMKINNVLWAKAVKL